MFTHNLKREKKYTRPETNSQNAWKWMLGRWWTFLSGWPISRGELLVLRKVAKPDHSWMFFIWVYNIIIYPFFLRYTLQPLHLLCKHDAKTEETHFLVHVFCWLFFGPIQEKTHQLGRTLFGWEYPTWSGFQSHWQSLLHHPVPATKIGATMKKSVWWWIWGDPFFVINWPITFISIDKFFFGVSFGFGPKPFPRFWQWIKHGSFFAFCWFSYDFLWSPIDKPLEIPTREWIPSRKLQGFTGNMAVVENFNKNDSWYIDYFKQLWIFEKTWKLKNPHRNEGWHILGSTHLHCLGFQNVNFPCFGSARLTPPSSDSSIATSRHEPCTPGS